MATYTYSDIDMELSRGTDGDIVKNEDKDAIINSITNILETMTGSRRMVPEFSDNPTSMLFEPVDEITAKSIGDTILSAIEIWDDRININKLTIQPVHDDNKYICRLQLVIKSSGKFETIDFILRS